MRLLLLLSVLLSACAPGTRVFDPSDEWTLAREFSGRSALVGLDDGRAVRVRAVRMDPDSSSWVNVDTGAFEVVPTSGIVRITRPATAGEGVVRGAGQGAIAGAVVGGTLGLLFVSAFQDGSGAVPLVLAITVFGALDGAAMGALVGLILPGARTYVAAPAPADGPGEGANVGRGVLRPDLPALGLRASDPLNLRGSR